MGGPRIGKVRGLQQISTREGIFTMCAMDYRGSLRWEKEWRHVNHNSTLFAGPLSGLSSEIPSTRGVADRPGCVFLPGGFFWPPNTNFPQDWGGEGVDLRFLPTTAISC